MFLMMESIDCSYDLIFMYMSIGVYKDMYVCKFGFVFKVTELAHVQVDYLAEISTTFYEGGVGRGI